MTDNPGDQESRPEEEDKLTPINSELELMLLRLKEKHAAGQYEPDPHEDLRCTRCRRYPCVCEPSLPVKRQNAYNLISSLGSRDIDHVRLRPFEDKGEQAFARNLASQFLDNKRRLFTLLGTSGCGKSRLAMDLSKSFRAMGTPVLWITTPRLLAKLREALNNEDPSADQARRNIMRAEVLVLDDFGSEKSTEWAQEQLNALIDARYMNPEVKTIITTNLALSTINQRDRSRMLDRNLCYAVYMPGGDVRTRSDENTAEQLSRSYLYLGDERVLCLFCGSNVHALTCKDYSDEDRDQVGIYDF